MIEEPKTLRIGANVARRPSAAQIAAFQGMPTGFVVDAMFGAGQMQAEISPLMPDMGTVVGPAITADNRPSDVLATLGAIKFVQPGDVVVAGVQGWQGCASAGDRVCGFAKNSGAAGFVTDGPMRDFEGLADVGLPVWCTGLNPGSPYGTGPGQVGSAVMIGGQRVECGDMIIADRDGVVVVPFDMIDVVAARLPAVQDMELSMDAEVRDGLRLPQVIIDLVEGDDTEFLKD